MKKIWLITGVSRGLGRELAKAVLAQGDVVVGASRNGRCPLDAASGRLDVLPMDLSNWQQIQAIVEHAIKTFGRIDVLVNNAGFGLLSAIEEANDEELSQVYEANLFATLRVVRAALPAFRAQRFGLIINISSIAAMAPSPGAGLYASAKAGMEAFSESLSHELAPCLTRRNLLQMGSLHNQIGDPVRAAEATDFPQANS
jgi:NAD(P)-dependent dehydrogenase (short-subunit alcohol dehydrogenase family)